MKKLISISLAAVVVLTLTLTAASAGNISFSFALTTDKESYSTGETVSATLTLTRTDVSDTSFTLYSVQDYVTYDTSLLRLEAVDTSASGFSWETYDHKPGEVGFFRYTMQSDGISVSNPLTIAVLTFTALDEGGTAQLQNTRIEVGTRAGNKYDSVAADAEIAVIAPSHATRMLSAEVGGEAAVLTFNRAAIPGWLTFAAAYSEDGKCLSCVGSAVTTDEATLSFPIKGVENASYIKFFVLDNSTYAPLMPAFTIYTGGASE